jgi:hypothetical protein
MQVRALLSDDHFSVDGTQVQAWASMKDSNSEMSTQIISLKDRADLQPNSGHRDYSRLAAALTRSSGLGRRGKTRYPANLDLGSARPTLGRARSVGCFLLNQ